MIGIFRWGKEGEVIGYGNISNGGICNRLRNDSNATLGQKETN